MPSIVKKEVAGAMANSTTGGKPIDPKKLQLCDLPALRGEGDQKASTAALKSTLEGMGIDAALIRCVDGAWRQAADKIPPHCIPNMYVRMRNAAAADKLKGAFNTSMANDQDMAGEFKGKNGGRVPFMCRIGEGASKPQAPQPQRKKSKLGLA